MGRGAVGEGCGRGSGIYSFRTRAGTVHPPAEGATWDHETVLVPGFAQYTVATVLDDATAGMAYESLGTDAAGVTGFNVHFARFSLAVLGE